MTKDKVREFPSKLSQIIQFKIQLAYIKPLIWRRFLVDSSISLHQLHTIIQVVMGWRNYHLYDFTIHRNRYTTKHDDMDFMGEKDSEKAYLNDLGLEEKQKFTYQYDFGDSWDHSLTIEKILPINDEEMLPRCIKGARNCPPEDCGSFPGYQQLVEAMADPESEEAEELIDWLGEIYDPEKFDIDLINRRLSMLTPKKKSSKREKKS